MGMKYKLGDTLECTITGVRGKVAQVARHIYSQDRYRIQPPYNEKELKVPASYFIDESSLKFLKDSDLKQIPEYQDGPFNLGDTVKCTLNDQKGKIKERILSVNGCYSLNIAVKDAKGNPRQMTVEEKGCELVKKVKENKVKPEQRATGCYMEEVNM